MKRESEEPFSRLGKNKSTNNQPQKNTPPEDELEETRVERLGNAWRTLMRPFAGALILTAALGTVAAVTGHTEIIPPGIVSISSLLSANWISDAVKKAWGGDQFSKRQRRQLSALLEQHLESTAEVNQISEEKLFYEIDQSTQQILAQLTARFETLEQAIVQEGNKNNQQIVEQFRSILDQKFLENSEQQIDLLEKILNISIQTPEQIDTARNEIIDVFSSTFHDFEKAMAANFDDVKTQIKEGFEGLRFSSPEDEERKPIYGVRDLPDHFIPRPEILEVIELLKEENERASHLVVTLKSAGGQGKTALALSVAHTEEIQNMFSDGIYWFDFDPDFTQKGTGWDEKVKEVLKLFWFNISRRNDDESSTAILVEKIKGALSQRNVLVVLDDVWDYRIAELFQTALLSLSQGKVLVTARKKLFLDHEKTISIPVLSDSESRKLLLSWAQLETVDSSDEEYFQTVLENCGGVPLALRVAGAYISGEPHGWASLAEYFQHGNFDTLNERFGDRDNFNLFRLTQISADKLLEKTKNNYSDLAVFSKDKPIPIQYIKVIWKRKGFSEIDINNFLAQLVDTSLADYDPKEESITLHGLQWDYIYGMNDEIASQHVDVIESYRNECNGVWHRIEDDGYFFQKLPYHLKEAAYTDELHKLLLDLNWMRAKLQATSFRELREDYLLLPEDESVNILLKVLTLSAHSIEEDHGSLLSQIQGRLFGTSNPELKQMIDVQNVDPENILTPLVSSLLGPEDPLLETLNTRDNKAINKIRLAPDGKIISFSPMLSLNGKPMFSQEQMDVFDPNTREHQAIDVEEGEIRDFVASKDGMSLYVITNQGVLEERSIENPDERRVILLPEQYGEFTHVAISKDYNYIVLSSIQNEIIFSPLDDLSQLRSYTLEEKINNVTLTPDCKFIAFISESGMWKIDTETGKTNGVEVNGPNGVAISDDGKFTACGGFKRFSIVNWENGESLNIRLGRGNYTGPIGPVFIEHPDLGLLVACASAASRSILIFKTDDFSVVSETRSTHKNEIMDLIFDDKTSTLISAGFDGSINLWDLDTLVKEKQNTKTHIGAMTILPDGKHVVVSRLGKILEVWDLETLEIIKRIKYEVKGRMHSLTEATSLAPYGEKGEEIILKFTDSQLRVLNLEESLNSQVISENLDYSNGHITDNGKYVVQSFPGRTEIKDLTMGETIYTLPEIQVRTLLSGVAVLPEINRAFITVEDNSIEVWDLENNKLVETIQNEHRVTTMIISPNKKHLIYGLALGGLVVVDLKTMSAHQLETHDDDVFGLAMDLNNRYLISVGFDGVIKIFDIPSGSQQPVKELKTDSSLTCCKITSDGSKLIVGDTNGNISFFEINSEKN